MIFEGVTEMVSDPDSTFKLTKSGAKRSYQKAPKPGWVYEIPDREFGNYYCAMSVGTTACFFDTWSLTHLSIPNLKGIPIFLSLMVSDHVVKRNWKKIGELPIEGDLANFAKFRHQSVGSSVVNLYDEKDGSFTPVNESEVIGLPVLAVWDGNMQVIEVLRYRFFRSPPLNDHKRMLVGREI